MGKGGCVITTPQPAPATLSPEDLTTTSQTTRRPLRQITPSLLATKTTVDECWIAYEGYVYDVTKWLPKHPGGIRSIMSAAGHDASSVMKSLHTPDTLSKYIRRVRKVGMLVKEPTTTTTSVSSLVSSPPAAASIPSVETEGGDTASLTPTSSSDDFTEEEPSIASSNDDLDTSTTTSTTSTSNSTVVESAASMKRRNAESRNELIHAEFTRLNEKLIQEGWYKSTPLTYWSPLLRILSFLSIGVYLVLDSQSRGNGPLKMCELTLGSLFLGFFFQNTAFMGHDAGHGSVFGNFQIDFWFGLVVGNLLTGIDVGWWKSTHYVHHSATNAVHDDPDIQHMPLLCFDERMADSRWSTYHGRYMPFDDIAAMIIPYQHWYFYPVMAVARVNLYIQSFIHLIKTCPFANFGDAGESVIDERTGEVKEKYAWPKPSNTLWFACVACLGVFWTGMYQLLSRLDMTSTIVCFAVMHFSAGLLHVQILLSHVAMHYCADGSGYVGAISAPNGNDEAGYYEWQALSTMDVDCPTYMDWFHGGLQFQLEHHLFPRVPRWKLRELVPLTDAIFAKYDIPVVRVPFIEANRMILKHMATVGDRKSVV